MGIDGDLIGDLMEDLMVDLMGLISFLGNSSSIAGWFESWMEYDDFMGFHWDNNHV